MYISKLQEKKRLMHVHSSLKEAWASFFNMIANASYLMFLKVGQKVAESKFGKKAARSFSKLL